MRLEIDAYHIRNWQMADAASLVKYAHNRNISGQLRDAFPYPYTHADAEAFLARVSAADSTLLFAIATPWEAIGGIGLEPGVDVHRYTAELGYWLAESYWGRGIMTRAVKRLTAYALSELGLIRVFAEPFATNVGSARVLEKAGFTCEGIMRSNVVKDGQVLDQYLYSRIGHAGLACEPTR